MFTLRLLGGFALEDDGAALTGRAVQKRRLALLALIALAPGRTISRDKVVAYLWPEGDTEQVRHLLSVGLHDLRKVLGEVIVTRGGDLALVDIFQSDVENFDSAFAAGDFRRAVDLYAGPFLDGFYLSDAPEFEQWVEVERKRLHERYCNALEKFAEELTRADDAGQAVEIWRRLVREDPYNSRLAVGYMKALARAGDRAASIQHARVHEIMLREEFGMQPDPEITELAARLREEPSVAAPLPSPMGPSDTGHRPVQTTNTSTGDDRNLSGSSDGATATSRHEGFLPPGRSHDAPSRSQGDAVGSDAGSPVATSTTSNARPAKPPGRRRLRLQRRRRAVIAIVFILSIASLGLYARQKPVERATSIAVLPLTDLSPANDNEFFSDGLTDEITNALASVEGLSVVARTSAFSFKETNRDVKEIGAALGVANILEGSVRRNGDEVRIYVRLVDADTGFDLWSRTYDRTLSDILAVQGDIARAVATALEVRLGGGQDAIARMSTDDPEAAELYWLGRYHWRRRTAEGFQRALQYFGSAVARDSAFAAAYTGLADVYALLGAYDYGVLPPDTALPIARSMLERALQLDPGSAEARAALGNLLFVYEWDIAGAEAEFGKAIALKPEYAPAYHWRALALMATGREREALGAIERARQLEPLSTVITSATARIEYLGRHYARAIREYRNAIELDSTFVVAHLGLGLTLVQTGDFDAAIAEYEMGRRLSGDRPVILALLAHAHALAGRTAEATFLLEQLEMIGRERYVPSEYLAIVHIALGHTTEAARELERAYEDRSGAMTLLGLDPLFDPVRVDPRFEALKRKIPFLPK